MAWRGWWQGGRGAAKKEVIGGRKEELVVESHKIREVFGGDVPGGWSGAADLRGFGGARMRQSPPSKPVTPAQKGATAPSGGIPSALPPTEHIPALPHLLH